MHIVCGLGNPGRKYANTRHNIGFMVVDELASRLAKASPESFSNKFKGEFFTVKRPEHEILLLKPQTYMNLSGECLRDIAGFYKVAAGGVIIVCDDVSLPFGKIRVRAAGSDGGHNGLKSIFGLMGINSIARVRVGIGAMQEPKDGGAVLTGQPDYSKIDLADYVLMKFSQAECAHLKSVVEFAASAAVAFVEKGLNFAMNNFNNKFGFSLPPVLETEKKNG